MIETIITYLVNTFAINKVKAIFIFIIGMFGGMIGGYSLMIKALFILLVLDFILGFSIAFFEKKLSKSKFQLGLLKILGYCIALIVFHQADQTIMGFNIFGIGILEFGIAYLGINETISNLKHLSKVGVPIPKKLIERLETYKNNLDIKSFSKGNSQKQSN